MRRKSNRWHRDKNGGQHPVDFGSCQHEYGVFRRLFQRLQERIGRFRRELVHLVDEVEFVAAAHRREVHALAQAANILDATVGGGVKLDEIEKAAFHDVRTRVALAARLGLDALQAVEGFRQDTRQRGLA